MRPRPYHLFSTFSAKPGKSRTSPQNRSRLNGVDKGALDLIEGHNPDDRSQEREHKR